MRYFQELRKNKRMKMFLMCLYPQADRETFLSKNGKYAWSSSNSESNQGRTAAPNIRMTPGPTRYSGCPCPGHFIHLSPVHHTSHQKNPPGEYKFGGFPGIWRKLEKYG
ncbi:hypothetical protein ATANTOWER_009604 [Ataeniobius toweri]|uniref:Uncharacterized protein n=1 Tax=Ataeniobius toweri TaxID=208326 RepID=A0ABU7AL43_9TELE|nr:hypothetical protein [Ataeniobius toweri]